MDYAALLYAVSDGVATITLNRPETLNSLNDQLMMELARALDKSGRDDEVRVLVITGAGRGFCSGGDFGYSQVRRGEATSGEREQRLARLDEGRIPVVVGKLVLGLQRIKDKPTIAMVNGAAVGAGFVIALACDMRIGSEHTRFMTAFNKIGLANGEGGAWLLPRIVGLPKACELIFTGDFVEAEEAYRIGLLNRLVPADKLREETMALAHRLAQGSPIALRLDKHMIYEGLDANLETALAFGSTCLGITLHSEDHKEGILAFAEKRQPVFRGK